MSARPTESLVFTGQLWFWRGPAPWYFVTVPDAQCEELRDSSAEVSYGWGMIPVTVRVGDTEWTTSLFPKDGAYVVPVKAHARAAEHLDAGDTVTITLTVSQPGQLGPRSLSGR